MSAFPLLSLIVFTPWLGAALLAAWRRAPDHTARSLGIAFSTSTLVLTLVTLTVFDPAHTGSQLVERHAWIAALNVHYHLALDGLSLVLVLLTAIVTPAALLASWSLSTQNPQPTTQNHSELQTQNSKLHTAPPSPRAYTALFLALQGSALGVFLARDFFHWFLFWELSLVPAFFLIKLWGGPAATRAAYQFFIYTVGGSAFMLLGFAALFAATGTLDFDELSRLAANGTLQEKIASLGGAVPSPRGLQLSQLIFLGVLLGLAVKVPLWPFHTWLPPAYAEAPTGASMFLTGVMSKMGLYGFLRILWPVFPAQLHAASTILLWLAVAGVVLGAYAALRQTDLKRMIAYGSLNHLSYCLVALFAVSAATGGPKPAPEAATAALSGTILQIFNHGLSAAALFYCIGILETRAGGLRGLADFGGIRAAAPIFAGLCGIALFSSLGLPGLNGFVGEFLIFRGVFGLAPAAAAVACLGLLATALFLLTFWQRVFHGPRVATAPAFADLRGLEYAPLVPLVALMFLLGLAPQLLVTLFNPLVTTWADHLVR